jgi:ABC-type lipoprotein export system ATPase subunit
VPIALAGLIPHPLQSSDRLSQIWRQEVLIEEGARVFVQAPSGTGKSTLIHLLYGLRNDYDGEARWNEKELRALDDETVSAFRAGDVSIIFQDLRLFPDLTLCENLEVKRALANTVSVKEMDEWIIRLGLDHRRHALASTLSYGERQRTAIVRGLVQPFKWLLMDEPFSHLDEENIVRAATLIDEVVTRLNAGFLYADLDDNAHFTYTRKLRL